MAPKRSTQARSRGKVHLTQGRALLAELEYHIPPITIYISGLWYNKKRRCSGTFIGLCIHEAAGSIPFVRKATICKARQRKPGGGTPLRRAVSPCGTTPPSTACLMSLPACPCAVAKPWNFETCTQHTRSPKTSLLLRCHPKYTHISDQDPTTLIAQKNQRS